MGNERKELLEHLTKCFYTDLMKCVERLTIDEQIYFVEALFEIKGLALTYEEEEGPVNALTTEKLVQESLLSKFRGRLRHFMEIRFYEYFFLDRYNTGRLWKRLKIENYPILSKDEFLTLCLQIHFILTKIKTALLLEDPDSTKTTMHTGDFNIQDIPAEVVQTQKHREINLSRQILALYYMIIEAGIYPRTTANVSDITRLAHVLFNKSFTTLQNSEIYKKFRNVPSIKQDTHLLRDLEFILPYFTSLGMEKAVSEILKDIDTAMGYSKEFKQQRKNNDRL